jgi:NAD(P)-dependent dehydrogenase (short-subunit alcohol dehydrogenase family)
MKLKNKVVIVTGGASGIGRALAQRIAEEEPAGVVIADLNRDAAEAAAAEIDPAALGLACDVTSESDLAELIAKAQTAFGPVDAFFANAGVAIGGSEQTPEETWDLALAVNLRAHVTAARLLVPGWLQRGSGCFVVTASAAGLLTQIGVAPYAVSKHAAVAFAEWLSVTYGDQGVHVSCVCPMGVDTPMMAAAEDGGAGMDSTGVESVRAAGEILAPRDVAETVIQGLADERFLILPHPAVLEYFQRKASDYDRWLAGMRRLRSAVSSSA